MRWRFRNAGLAHGCEFAAQDRDNFFAEDVDLFEHCLLWQARVVDEEQLALVVTGPVAEAEGAFNDLLPTVSGVWAENSSRLGPWPYTGALSK